MWAQLRELLRLDLGAVDVHKGVMGLSAILAFALFVAIFGPVGMVAALATLFVIIADHPGPPRDRGLGLLLMTALGTGIALVGVWAGPQHALVASFLTFVVVALATLAAGFGPALALRGMLLSVWAVIAVGLAGATESALQLPVAFAGGGLIAAVVIFVRTRALPEPSVEEEAVTAARTLEQVVRSPLGWFALLRATSAGIAMVLGIWLFPVHPIWATLTVILVLKPRAGEAVASGLLRTVGTLVGVLAAETLIWLSDGDATVVALGFMVAGFGMAALQRVSYAVFVACLTALLVLADQLVAGTGDATATDRLLATLLGAGIAFGAIAVGRVVMRRPIAGMQPAPAEEDTDPTPG